MSSQQSRGVNIAGQTLSVDPRTGRLERLARPFPKSAFREIARDHTVIMQHADGTTSEIVITGATYAELRDQDFILALVTGDWDDYLMKNRVTDEMWHQFVQSLAIKYPHLVHVADTIKPSRDDREFAA